MRFLTARSFNFLRLGGEETVHPQLWGALRCGAHWLKKNPPPRSCAATILRRPHADAATAGHTPTATRRRCHLASAGSLPQRWTATVQQTNRMAPPILTANTCPISSACCTSGSPRVFTSTAETRPLPESLNLC